jgi:uncharacterized repeat protein (TIGR03803 family)
MLGTRLKTAAFQSAVVLALVGGLASFAEAQTYKVLYSFTGGADGGGAWGGVVMDKQGNLYGTTSGGGAHGYGTVFELSPNPDGTWNETVAHSFMLFDGSVPESYLIFDAAGNLYGVAPGGGSGSGTAFEMSPSGGTWSLTVLYKFGAYKGDASSPSGGLVLDSHGNLFGVGGGGAIGSGGAVFELSPGSSGWTESVVYSFGGNKGTGGDVLSTGVTLDSKDNLYGVTLLGGDLQCAVYGCGTAFKLTRSGSGTWGEIVMHSFTGPPSDGQTPGYGRLFYDGKGHVYGTTQTGGGMGCSLNGGCGTVYRLTQGSKGWKETVIHEFGNGSEGAYPVAGLIFDSAGNAYGTTSAGGSACDCGVVYKLTPTASGHWKYTVLHFFQGTDGAGPSAELFLDNSGNLYGTTATGGSGGAGVAFEIIP